MITKTERAELKSLVRQQFKVLRAEVHQRMTEVLADVEQEIADRYAEDDKTWMEAATRARDIAQEADAKPPWCASIARIRAIYAKLGVDATAIHYMPPHQPRQERVALRMLATTKLQAQVKEADLLRTLGIGALESDEANTFLAGIPAVGELVPVARLAELEASLGDTE